MLNVGASGKRQWVISKSLEKLKWRMAEREHVRTGLERHVEFMKIEITGKQLALWI